MSNHLFFINFGNISREKIQIPNCCHCAFGAGSAGKQRGTRTFCLPPRSTHKGHSSFVHLIVRSYACKHARDSHLFGGCASSTTWTLCLAQRHGCYYPGLVTGRDTCNARAKRPPGSLSAVLASSVNKENMFLTTFMGILDIPSRRFSYANAGHVVPLIDCSNGFERIVAKPIWCLLLQKTQNINKMK